MHSFGEVSLVEWARAGRKGETVLMPKDRQRDFFDKCVYANLLPADDELRSLK